MGQFGVTEGEYTLVVVHFLTGLYGQDFWKIKAIDILPASLTNLKDSHKLFHYIFTEDLGTVVIHGFAITIVITILYVLIGTLIKAHDRAQALG